ncbi:hypothetical protein [Alkalilimnicola sp. S0819]|uniref:hypothetical protein n=1 Tax=Alkalilimnicola sp. S0819 TaxID=2613922 RepID=UPI001261ECA2|nr:hypothetical protein [Alkalilimnicola sp. S0819]KAB7627543.1 hypothetical protein F3N43_03515 [Alkalilimnicola sp. S0819]MPQ15697.1 hypothetical protein [Alkalilimnicola sp. S0819]
MKASRVIVALVALGVGGVTGYWLGSPAAVDEVPALVEHPAPSPLRDGPRDGWAFQQRPAQEPTANGAIVERGTDAETPEFEAFEDPRIAQRARDQALATVDRLAMALNSAAFGNEREIQALKQALLDKAGVDSLALQGIIDVFRTDPGSVLGQHLGSLLAEIKDPEVETMAQQLVRSGAPDQMKAGLMVLGELGIPSEETLRMTQQIIRQPYSDPDLLMGAIRAMPVMPMSQHATAESLSSLTELAAHHPHDGVRSNSLFKISDWAKDGEDLRPVVQALAAHRPTDDRISAAMALSRSTVVDDSLRRTLLDRMADANELWEVRQYSAAALERFKLSGSEYQRLESFRREQMDLQHNG